jgi:hypothetical protein
MGKKAKAAISGIVFVVSGGLAWSDNISYSWNPSGSDSLTDSRYKSDRNATSNVVNGNITNGNIKSTAAIAQSKIDSLTGWITSRTSFTSTIDGNRMFRSGNAMSFFSNDTIANSGDYTFITDSTDTLLQIRVDSTIFHNPVIVKYDDTTVADVPGLTISGHGGGRTTFSPGDITINESGNGYSTLSLSGSGSGRVKVGGNDVLTMSSAGQVTFGVSSPLPVYSIMADQSIYTEDSIVAVDHVIADGFFGDTAIIDEMFAVSDSIIVGKGIASVGEYTVDFRGNGSDAGHLRYTYGSNPDPTGTPVIADVMLSSTSFSVLMPHVDKGDVSPLHITYPERTVHIGSSSFHEDSAGAVALTVNGASDFSGGNVGLGLDQGDTINVSGTLKLNGPVDGFTFESPDNVHRSDTVSVSVPSITDPDIATAVVDVSSAITYIPGIGDIVYAVPLEALPSNCRFLNAWVYTADGVYVTFGSEGGNVTGAARNFIFVFVDL